MAIRTKQVLKGTVTINSGFTAVQVSIPSVTLAKSLLTFTYRTVSYNITEPDSGLFRAWFINSTTIRFERAYPAGVALRINWNIQEFTAGSNINIEHLSASNVSDGSILAITDVGSISNAFVIASYENQGLDTAENDFLFPEITSTTQITNRLDVSMLDDVSYQVVSSSEINTQIADTGNISGSSKLVAISTIATGRTVLKGYSESRSSSVAFSWLGTVEISSSTQLNFLYGSSGHSKRSYAYVIEWPSNFEAWWGFANTTADSTNISFGPCSDVSRTVVYPLDTGNISNGRVGSESNDSFGVLSFDHEITSTSNIFVQRGAGFGNNATILTQALEDTGPSEDSGGNNDLVNGGLVNSGLINGGLVQ